MSNNKEEKSIKDLPEWVNMVNTILKNYQMMIDKIDASRAEFLKMFGPKNIKEQKDGNINQ